MVAVKVCVVGASGTVGRHVVGELHARGASVRALVRDPARAGTVLGEQADLVVGDFDHPASVRRALEDADAVFLTSADGPSKVDHENAVIDAARAVGEPRIVKLASIGSATGSPVATWDWHGRITDHLVASGLEHVVLQANFFMSNLAMAADSIRHAGAIFAPAGGARIAMIDPRDVGAAAAAVLADRDHAGRTYVLTGPQALTYDDVAAQLSEALGRQVAFVDVPGPASTAALLEAGMPPWLADFLPALFAELRDGAGVDVTDSVHRLTGCAPRSFADFARDHRSLFAG